MWTGSTGKKRQRKPSRYSSEVTITLIYLDALSAGDQGVRVSFTGEIDQARAVSRLCSPVAVADFSGVTGPR